MSASDLFWQDHWKKVVGGIVAFVIAILLAGAVMLYVSHVRSSAEALYSLAATPEKLHEVIEQYPRSTVAGDARIRLATQLREEGKLDEAIAMLTTFTSVNTDHPMIGAAWLSLGEVQQLKGDKDAALDAYRKVSGSYPKSYAAPFALIAEARLIESQGAAGEAKAILESVGVNYPETPAAMVANSELAKYGQAKTLQQPQTTP